MLYYCDDNTTFNDFKAYCESSHKIDFYCDLETLKTNTKALKIKGGKKSLVQTWQYSHCVSFPWNNEVKTIAFANADDFLRAYFSCAKPKVYYVYRVNKKTGKKRRERHARSHIIKLHYFNGNGFDNHFIVQDTLKKDWGCVERNMYLRGDEWRYNMKTKNMLTANELLTARVKSATKCEFYAYITSGKNGVLIESVDDYPKFSMSLRKIGKMMKKLGIVKDEDLKTELQYDKYDRHKPMTYQEAKSYCYDVFEKLTQKEKRYIFNDTKLYCYAMMNFETLMYGFDPKVRTMTLNVQKAYTNPNGIYNPMVDIQLRRSIKAPNRGEFGYKQKLSDYDFDGKNLMDWIYLFYFGGACHYNDRLVNQKLTVRWGSADSNSHYPSSYCKHDLPLGEPIQWKTYDEYTKIPINWDSDNVTALYETSVDFFNYCLMNCKSHYMRTGIYHYLNRPNEPNSRYLTNIHLKAFRENCGIPLTTIPVKRMLEIKNEPFAGKETVYDFYKIKTECKGFEVNYVDGTPFHIEITDKPIPSYMIGENKKANAKHCINNLYGSPAIQAAYPLCLIDESGEINRIPNGHINSERNVLFSMATTAWAWYHLWEPLQGFTPEQIDENMLYQDTDSLYMKEELLDLVIADKPHLFNPYNLGCWDIEHRGNQFYIATHKKYCFVDDESGLDFRFGGVPKEAFNTNCSFDEFVECYMKVGAEVPNNRAIMTVDNKPCIYDTITKVEKAYMYREYVSSIEYSEYLELIDKARQEMITNDYHDFLYIMSELGGLTKQMIEPYIRPTEKKETMFDFLDGCRKLKQKAHQFYETPL